MALVGWECSELSGPATLPCAPISARTVAPARSAASADMTTTAHAPSEICEAEPAVMVPPAPNAGRSLLSDSTVLSADAAEAAGAPVLAEVGAHGCVAGPDNSLQSQPANAIAHALRKAGLTAADLDLIEINEAFAAVAIQSMRDLGVGPDKVNVNGGAIAIGHPIGMSGARIVLHLAYELRRRGGGLGAAALCGGGGQGDALLLRVPAPGAGD